MPLAPADPIHQDYNTMLFDGSFTHVGQLGGPLNDALTARLLVKVDIKGITEGELPPWWNIAMTRPDGTVLILESGMWVVVSSLGKIRVLDDTAYRAEFIVPA